MIALPAKPAGKTHRYFWLLALAVFAGNAVLAWNWTQWTGEPLPEWPLGIDVLLLLPLAYLWVHRQRGWKQALGGAAALFGFGVLAGSWLLPDASKQLWRHLEALRIPAILLLVALQGMLFAGIARAAWRSRRTQPIEDAVQEGLERTLGANAMSRLLALESRLWIYALLPRPAPAGFAGRQHFSVHAQGGNVSNQVAFLVIVGAEIPLLHVLLHWMWSPLAAIVVTVLSLYGWLFLWAEYRASWLRPISLEGSHLRIRHGIAIDYNVSLACIAQAHAYRGPTHRAAGRLRAYGMGQPNIRLQLHPDTRIATSFGFVAAHEILLGVDHPAALLAALSDPHADPVASRS